jgi:hypothetical protein
MSLSAGTRLGAYEVLTLIGAGGMGQVYRARDTKLGRDVAIKVVSDGFGHDPERMARFKREAHMLASLNHPHIAAIYGLEESAGAQFLVMEREHDLGHGERLVPSATARKPRRVAVVLGCVFAVRVDEDVDVRQLHQLPVRREAVHVVGFQERRCPVDVAPGEVASGTGGDELEASGVVIASATGPLAR